MPTFTTATFSSTRAPALVPAPLVKPTFIPHLLRLPSTSNTTPVATPRPATPYCPVRHASHHAFIPAPLPHPHPLHKALVPPPVRPSNPAVARLSYTPPPPPFQHLNASHAPGNPASTSASTPSARSYVAPTLSVTPPHAHSRPVPLSATPLSWPAVQPLPSHPSTVAPQVHLHPVTPSTDVILPPSASLPPPHPHTQPFPQSTPFHPAPIPTSATTSGTTSATTANFQASLPPESHESTETSGDKAASKDVTTSFRKGRPRGHRHSEESRRKIGLANRGNTPWNKGRPHSEETKRKIAESTRRAMLRPELRELLKQRARGRRHSEQTKLKIRQTSRLTRGGNSAHSGKKGKERVPFLFEPHVVQNLNETVDRNLEVKFPLVDEKLTITRPPVSAETRAKLSRSIKELWDTNADYRARVTAKLDGVRAMRFKSFKQPRDKSSMTFSQSSSPTKSHSNVTPVKSEQGEVGWDTAAATPDLKRGVKLKAVKAEQDYEGNNIVYDRSDADVTEEDMNTPNLKRGVIFEDVEADEDGGEDEDDSENVVDKILYDRDDADMKAEESNTAKRRSEDKRPRTKDKESFFNSQALLLTKEDLGIDGSHGDGLIPGYDFEQMAFDGLGHVLSDEGFPRNGGNVVQNNPLDSSGVDDSAMPFLNLDNDSNFGMERDVSAEDMERELSTDLSRRLENDGESRPVTNGSISGFGEIQAGDDILAGLKEESRSLNFLEVTGQDEFSRSP